MTVSKRIDQAMRWLAGDLDASPVLTAVLSLEGAWLGMNPSFAKALGGRRSDFVGQAFAQVVAPEDQEAYADVRQALRRDDKTSAQGRMSLSVRGGGQCRLDTAWMVLHSDTGEPACLLLKAWDVTLQESRDHLLERTRDHHSLVIEANRIGIFEVDVQTGVVFCDALAEEALGYEPGQMDGQKLRDLRRKHAFLPLSSAESAAREAFSRRRGQMLNAHVMLMTKRVRDAQGHPIWLRIGLRRVPVNRADGRTKMLGSLQNVTAEVERQVTLDEAQQTLRETQWLMQAASEGSGVGHWTANLETGVFWHNEINLANLGFEPGEFALSMPTFYSLVHPDDRDRVAAAFNRARVAVDNAFRVDFRARQKDGSFIWAGASGRGVYNAAGEFVVYGAMQDISGRIADEELLRQMAQEAEAARDRLQRLAEWVPGGLYEMHNLPDGGRKMAYFSPGLAAVFDLDPEDLRSDPLAGFGRILPDEVPRIRERQQAALETNSPFDYTFRVRCRDDSIRWVKAVSRPSRTSDGTVIWYGSAYDVTEEVAKSEALAEAQRQTEFLALHDGLTGLPNRRYFDAELAKRLAASEGEDVLTLVRIDLDHFKHVNDTLGHDAGDAVLVHVAEVLARFKRQEDFAARLGGDEFALMLAPGSEVSGQHGAMALATRMRDALAKPLTIEGRVARFGGSFGIASSRLMPGQRDKLLSYADAALYDAKENGRGLVKVFTPELYERMQTVQRIAQEIEEGLEVGQFVPFFQAQVAAQSGDLAGFEVLARWNHPKDGLRMPDSFLPVAEQIKRVQDIDRTVFEQAMGIARDLMQQGLHIPKLSFNISWGRLHDPEFISSVSDHMIEGVKVSFELLESILLEDLTPTMQFHIDSLREAGIGIEMDDFGSGRASVVGMMQVAPDAIKLDQRLVRPITEDKKAVRLVSALVDIAQGLNIDVIAEGVETLEHATVLRMLECTALQGYAFSRPMSAEALRAYLLEYAPVDLNVA